MSKKYTGTLKKVSQNVNNIRTEYVDGFYLDKPKAGRCFMLFARSLDPEKDFRLIQTSVVREVSETNDFVHLITFKTMNSEYTLTVDEEEVE